MSEFNIVKKNFPKKKTKLAKKYLKIFNQVYKDNRDGKGLFNFLIAYLENWAHRTVSYRQNKKDKILEIGGGTLNHLKYENHLHLLSQPSSSIFFKIYVNLNLNFNMSSIDYSANFEVQQYYF